MKKERDALGLFLAEGHKCVVDLLPAFPLENLICTQEWVQKNPELASRYESKILISDRRGLEIISSLKSLPDVIAVFKKPSQLENAEPSSQTVLLLDEIQDPGNLGTIIRSCDWFGVYEIYASGSTADAFSPKVVQATMGSLARVKVNYVDLSKLIDENRDYKVVGTLLDGTPLKKADLSGKTFIIMGNEGRGISEELKRKIDVPVTIPPSNPTSHPDSLNVAIATAIILSNIPT